MTHSPNGPFASASAGPSASAKDRIDGRAVQIHARHLRYRGGERPFVMTNLRRGEGLPTVVRFIETSGGLGH